ncbi:hypothetical protein D9M71_493340 [compost metagenome]
MDDRPRLGRSGHPCGVHVAAAICRLCSGRARGGLRDPLGSGCGDDAELARPAATPDQYPLAQPQCLVVARVQLQWPDLPAAGPATARHHQGGHQSRSVVVADPAVALPGCSGDFCGAGDVAFCLGTEHLALDRGDPSLARQGRPGAGAQRPFLLAADHRGGAWCGNPGRCHVGAIVD